MLAELLQLKRPLIVFDLETTDADVTTARIVQIAFRVHRPDRTIVAYKTLVNPPAGVTISEGAITAHGITEEILRTGCARCRAPRGSHPHRTCDDFKMVPTFKDLAPNLVRGFSNADLAGFNHARFDMPVLELEFQRAGCDIDFAGVRVIDASRIWQVLQPRTLSDAVEEFAGRKLDGAHDAENDVQGTEDALIGQLTGHKRSTDLPRTVDELHEKLYPNSIDYEGKFVFNEAGVPVLNFGKDKGKPMQECKSYLRWMTTASFSPTVKRIAENAINGVFPRKPTLPL